MKIKKDICAIIPVAGSGTRLRPHTHTWPKVLLTVGDKPIIGHILDEIKSLRIRKVHMVIGYLGEKIKKYVDEKYPELEVDYTVQKEPKGLGHAIWMVKGKAEGPCLILLGDTIISADFRKFLSSPHDMIGVKKVDDPRRFGVVHLKNGFVSKLVEKPKEPKSNLAIVGLYYFGKVEKVFLALSKLAQSGKKTRGEMQLTDALEIMVRSGHRIKTAQIDGWHDCGKKETIIATNRYMLGRKRFRRSVKGALVKNPVFIAESARIKNSIIGPYVSVGENSVIEDSIITDSIINSGAVISNMNLDQSLIGPNAVLKGRIESVNIGENSEINFNTQ